MASGAEIPDPLDRLTPDMAAEVWRNLLVWSAVGVGCVAALFGFMAVVADPSLGSFARGFAAVLFAIFLVAVVLVAGMVLVLVYLFECWPALIGRRTLRERFGVPAEALSAQARRRRAGDRGLWAAFGRGVVVGLAFAEAGLLATRALSGRWLFLGPAAILVVMAGNLAAQAWMVRRAVSEQVPVAGRSEA